MSTMRRGRHDCSTSRTEYETPVADCLEQCATGIRAIDSGWECTLRGEVPLLVTARLKNHWLRLCSSLSGQSSSRPTPEILDRMLAQNVKLAGGAKFTLAEDPPLPCLSAEILLDDEPSDLGVKISRACDGFSQALQEFAGGPNRREPDAEPAQADCNKEESDELAADLAALCKETGWPLARRAGDQVAVDLDVPGGFYQALVQSRGQKGLHLGVDIMSCAVHRRCQSICRQRIAASCVPVPADGAGDDADCRRRRRVRLGDLAGPCCQRAGGGVRVGRALAGMSPLGTRSCDVSTRRDVCAEISCAPRLVFVEDYPLFVVTSAV